MMRAAIQYSVFLSFSQYKLTWHQIFSTSSTSPICMFLIITMKINRSTDLNTFANHILFRTSFIYMVLFHILFFVLLGVLFISEYFLFKNGENANSNVLRLFSSC